MPSALESIRHLSEALFQYTDADAMVRQVLDTALDVIGAEAGCILLADPAHRHLMFRYVVGPSATQLHGTAIPWDKGIAGAVFSSGRPEMIQAAHQDPRHFTLTDRLTGYESRDMLVVPLKRHGGEPIGVIEVLNKTTGSVGPQDLDVLVVIASIAAAAIEHAQTAEALRQKELQLQQSQKMEAVGRLAGGIAHDFNNLLTIMQGFSELVLSALPPESHTRKCAEEVMKAVARAASLTKHLLTFSHKQAGEPRPVRLNELVLDIEKMLCRLIGPDIALLTNLDPQLGWIHTDPGQIEQIIMNLAVNARDAMPNGGALTISTSNVRLSAQDADRLPGLAEGPYIRLAVTDSGCGIDPAIQPRLFEPFFTTKAPGKGTGLGLSIVYGIVKQNHGHITVSSSVGRGSTFTMYLPQTPAPAPTATGADSSSDTARGSERILIVDDEESILTLEKGLLESHGYQVLAANSGREALRLCRETREPIHLLVTDLLMPDMNGQELALQVAALQPTIPALYVSGYPRETEEPADATVGKTAFLQKPFAADTLLHHVRQALDHSDAHPAARHSPRPLTTTAP